MRCCDVIVQVTCRVAALSNTAPSRLTLERLEMLVTIYSTSSSYLEGLSRKIYNAERC